MDCNSTDSAKEDTVAVRVIRKVVKEVNKMILFGRRHRCGAVRLLKVDATHEWTERPLGVRQVISQGGEPVGQAESIQLSRMATMSAATVRIDRSFLSMMMVLKPVSSIYSKI